MILETLAILASVFGISKVIGNEPDSVPKKKEDRLDSKGLDPDIFQLDKPKNPGTMIDSSHEIANKEPKGQTHEVSKIEKMENSSTLVEPILGKKKNSIALKGAALDGLKFGEPETGTLPEKIISIKEPKGQAIVVPLGNSGTSSQTLPEKKYDNIEVSTRDVSQLGKKDDKDDYQTTLEKNKTSKAKKHAIKAQKAAIMARNMSHNLGSHVMAYLKQQLYSTESILGSQDHVLHDIYQGNGMFTNSVESTQLPFLVGLGQFINYLQERQDYIATVATNYIPYPSPVDFKEAIFDGINPDLKWLRHTKTDNTRNKPFNILLNYIAKSEGYTRQNIEIGTKSKKGRYLQINYVDYNYNDQVISKIDGFKPGDLEIAKGENSTILAIPGGLIGRQAVFSIIENITRNAAKHEKVGDENLEINMGLIDGSKIDMYPNTWITEDIKKCYSGTKDIDNLFLLFITYKTNTNNPDSLQKGLWDGINENYVSEELEKNDTQSQELSDNESSRENELLKVIETNKGIKEIRISASWLRGNTDEEDYQKCFYNNGCISVSKEKNLSPLVYVDIQNIPYEQRNELSIRYIIGIKKQLGIKYLSASKNCQEEKVDFNIENSCFDGCEVKEFVLENEKNDDGCYEFVVTECDTDYENLRPFHNSRLIKFSSCKKYIPLIQNKLRNIPKDSVSYRTDIIRDMLYSVYAKIEWADNINKQMMINIWDRETYKSVYGTEEKLPKSSNTFENGINILQSDTSISDYRYIYRTHHDSQAKLFIEDKIKDQETFKNLRIEGISGSNSTSRIIRNNPKFNYQWYCSHIHALSENIAIIDERIFEAVTGISEKDLSKDLEEDLIEIRNVIDSSNFDQAFEQLCEEHDDLFRKYSRLQNVKSREELIELFNSIDTSNKISNNFFDGDKTRLGVLLSQKGIWIFNIIPDAIENAMHIVGYYHSIVEKKTYCFKIASIKTNPDNKIIINLYKKDYFNSILPGVKPVFDKISIHQGILDKLYKFADCKTEEEKISVTKELYRFFLSNHPEIDNKMYCLYIHSGRSKPSEFNMPQIVPFIQFSALDFAIHDSKYALVELLDYAKYEK